jgi:hypothetical protein
MNKKISTLAFAAIFSFSESTFAVPLIGADLSNFSILAGDYITYGANTPVNGTIGAVNYITSGIENQSSLLYVNQPNVLSGLSDLVNAKSALNNMSLGNALSNTLSGNNTFTPGVYTASSLTTDALANITLDGQGQINPYWVFNITDNLSTGAGTQVNIINSGSGGGVFWNTGGYASLGANTTFLGTLLSGSYISLGEGAINPCGSSFSSSYVSVGNGITGSSDCSSSGTWSGSFNALSGGLDIVDGIAVASVAAVPEAQTSALWLAGLGLMSFITRRLKPTQASLNLDSLNLSKSCMIL